MQSKEYGIRSVTPHQSPDGDSFPSRGSLKSEVEEIASEQVVFPDRKTADIVVKELWEAVDTLQKKVEELKNKIT